MHKVPAVNSLDVRAMADKMIASLGGAEVWSSARTIEVEIKGALASHPHTLDEYLVFDLDEPYTYISMTGEDFELYRSVQPESGWSIRDGNYSQMTPQQLKLFLDFWGASDHVLYHRIASADPDLILEKDNDLLKFSIADSEVAGYFKLNVKGEPVKWLTKTSDIEIEYVFGPLAKFGPVNLPVWGAQTNGSWYFENKKVTISDKAPDYSWEPHDRLNELR